MHPTMVAAATETLRQHSYELAAAIDALSGDLSGVFAAIAASESP